MLKRLIAPLQKILLQKGICPGCTSQLSKAKFREPRTEKIERVTCNCGRVYIYDNEVSTYRRALDSEI
jgi:RNase P subunit RPR2